MKKLLFIILCFITLKIEAQTVPILGDSTKVYSNRTDGRGNELMIRNRHKDTLGIAVNMGNGLMDWVNPMQLNDSTFIVGNKTFTIRGIGHEVDPIALLKTVSLNAGTGILVTGGTQPISGNPTFTITATGTSISGIGLGDLSASSPIIYDSTTGHFSFDTTIIHTSVYNDGRYLRTEVDPIALLKTVTLTAGTGISITGGAQALSGNPSFVITATGSSTSGIGLGDLSASSPIIYDSLTGHFSFDTTIIHTSIYNDGRYLRTYTETDPVYLANGVPKVRTITINGTTFDLSANRTWTISTGITTETDPIYTANGVPKVRTLTINGTAFDLSANRSWTIATGITTEVDPVYTANGVPKVRTLSINGTTFDLSVNRSWTIPVGITTETDPVYLANGVPRIRSLTINGVVHDLSADRTWTIATGISLTDLSAASPIVYNNLTGHFSFDTSIIHTSAYNEGRYLRTYTETDPVYTLNGVPKVRTITINGTTFDLSANRTWTISTGITTESDPVAIAKTVTITAGTGISVTGGVQTVGGNPSFVITNTGSSTSGIALTDLSANSPIVYNNLTGNFSFDTTTGHHSYGFYLTKFLTDFTETDPVYLADGVPKIRTLTINGVTFDLSANRSWTVGTAGVETDPIANAKNITINAGTGISISETASQTLGSAPSWTIVATGSGTSGIALTDLSAINPILYNNTTGVFSFDSTTGHHTYGFYLTKFLTNYTETDPIYTANGVPKIRTLTINGTAFDLSANRSWTISTGITTESDPIALAKVITLTAGYGLIIPQTAGQALSVPPSWTPKIDTTLISTRAWRDKLKDSLAAIIATKLSSETDPVYTANGVPKIRTLTINGTAFDLSANRTWTIPAGISLTDLSADSPIIYNNLTGHFRFDTTYLITQEEDPVYLTNGVPKVRTLTINGVSFDLAANRSWTIPIGITTETDPVANAKTISIIAGTNITVTGGTQALSGNPSFTINAASGISLTDLSASSPILYNNTTGHFSFDTTVIHTFAFNETRYLKTFTESDPVAIAKTVTINAGTGISITGTPSQTIGGNPTYTIVNTGSSTSGIALTDLSASSPIVYDNTTGHFSFDTTVIHTFAFNETRYLKTFTETDPIANAKTVTLHAGTGISITGTTSQTVGSEPEYTIVNTGSSTSGIALTDLSAITPILYDNTTGVFSFDTSQHHSRGFYDQRYLMSFTETDPVFTANGVPKIRTLTINGTAFDLSANRSWTIPTGITTEVDPVYSADGVPKLRQLSINGVTFDLSANRSWTVSSNPTGIAGGDLSGTYPNPDVIWSNGFTTYDARYLQSYTETDPLYTANGVPKIRTITINGTTFDLSANRTWTISTTPTGAAGGDLTGSYPNPLVDWTHGFTTYDARYLQAESFLGTVTNFSFTDGSGFDGTVTNATSTPTLSLTTSLATNQVPFIGAAGALTGSTNLTYLSSVLRANVDANNYVTLNGTDRFVEHSNSALGLSLFTHTTGAGNAPVIQMLRSIGTEGSPGAITTGFDLGWLNWLGYNGSAYVPGASIVGVADQTYTTSVSGTRLDVSLRKIGTNILARKAVFSGTGASFGNTITTALTIPTASIDLPANTINAGTAPLGFHMYSGIVPPVSDGKFWYMNGHLFFDLGSTRIMLDSVTGGGGGGPETDPIANAKTINLTAGSGISITGGSQTVGSNPSFTITATGGSSGTVTSVGLTLPSIFSVSGSPVTTSGTLTASLVSQTAAKVFASPTSSTGAPTFRALAASDIPTLTASKISDFVATSRTSISVTTTGTSGAATYNSSTGVINIPNYATGGGGYTDADARLAISLTTIGTSGTATYNNITGVLNVPTIPAQVNIIAGTNITLSGSYPNITISATGSAGLPSLANGLIWAGNGSDVATAVLPSGDLSMLNNGTFTLSAAAANTGVFGDATHTAQITVDVKGRVIAVTSIPISGASTPTLDQVLTAGNTTTHGIDMSNNFFDLNTGAVTVFNSTGTDAASLNADGITDGHIRIKSNGGSDALLFANNVTGGTKTLQFPNSSHTLAVSVNGTFADVNGNVTISSGSSQNLDQVLAVGNTSGTSMLLNSASDAAFQFAVGLRDDFTTSPDGVVFRSTRIPTAAIRFFDNSNEPSSGNNAIVMDSKNSSGTSLFHMNGRQLQLAFGGSTYTFIDGGFFTPGGALIGNDNNIGIPTGGTFRIQDGDNVASFANTTRLTLDAATGNLTLSSLAGTGSRMVVSDAAGLLSTAAIPTGGTPFNPIAGVGMLISGSYPNMTFNAVQTLDEVLGNGNQAFGNSALIQGIINTGFQQEHTSTNTTGVAYTVGTNDYHVYSDANVTLPTPTTGTSSSTRIIVIQNSNAGSSINVIPPTGFTVHDKGGVVYTTASPLILTQENESVTLKSVNGFWDVIARN